MPDESIVDADFVSDRVVCCAPCDRAEPYLPTEGGAPFCFLCEYVAQSESAIENPFEREEMASVYDTMCRHCADWEGNYRIGTAVEAIFQLYTERVQPTHPHLPSWSKQTIYEHIFQHTATPQRQVAGVADALHTQLMQLQRTTWEREAETAPAQPNLRHLAMFERLSARFFEAIKLRQSLS